MDENAMQAMIISPTPRTAGRVKKPGDDTVPD
jgi:hypothetical protein